MKQLLLLFFFFCLSANAQEKFTVYFDTGAAEATSSSVQKLGEWMATNRDIAIETINGFADKTGNASFNERLSEKRAVYVAGLLTSQNINLEYAVKNAFGEEQATGYNSVSDRKVEITYFKAGYAKSKPLETEITQQLNNAKVGDIIRLKNLNFRGGTTYVVEESKSVLKELLNAMLANPKLKIEIQGHICCDVEDVDNLSGRRAEEIFLYLTNNGIDKSRIATRGYGGHRPLQNNIQLIQNRRVEIEILSN
jgi:outer membrane protein OmpA-like peptidoglycan-associated protein